MYVQQQYNNSWSESKLYCFFGFKLEDSQHGCDIIPSSKFRLLRRAECSRKPVHSALVFHNEIFELLEMRFHFQPSVCLCKTVFTQQLHHTGEKKKFETLSKSPPFYICSHIYNRPNNKKALVLSFQAQPFLIPIKFFFVPSKQF